MRINEGTLDRVVRIGAGVALVGLTLAGIIGAWGWIGVVPLLTGIVGYCPLYSMLGMSTCPAARR